MGYTTNFKGKFNFNKPLSEHMYNFLVKLSETRRMRRNVGKEFGVEGEFFVDGTGSFGQGRDANIIDFNQEPYTQPGLWLKWAPTEDKQHLTWDEGEKFYGYTEWLVYLIHKILKPNGYVLNGTVIWQGEETGDVGKIIVKNNKVTVTPYDGKAKVVTPENCTEGKFNMQTDVVYLEPKVAPVKKTKKLELHTFEGKACELEDAIFVSTDGVSLECDKEPHRAFSLTPGKKYKITVEEVK